MKFIVYPPKILKLFIVSLPKKSKEFLKERRKKKREKEEVNVKFGKS